MLVGFVKVKTFMLVGFVVSVIILHRRYTGDTYSMILNAQSSYATHIYIYFLCALTL